MSGTVTVFWEDGGEKTFTDVLSVQETNGVPGDDTDGRLEMEQEEGNSYVYRADIRGYSTTAGVSEE